MKAKTKKGELDRLRSKIEQLENDLQVADQTKAREKDLSHGLERKLEDMSREIESLDGTNGSVFSNDFPMTHRLPTKA
jgi:hypothetical protein